MGTHHTRFPEFASQRSTLPGAESFDANTMSHSPFSSLSTTPFSTSNPTHQPPQKRRKLNNIQNAAENARLPCPYQYTAKGCIAAKCQFMHFESRADANKMKLRYILGDEYDEATIDMVVTQLLNTDASERAAENMREDAMEEEEDALSEDDVNMEYGLDEDGEPLYFSKTLEIKFSDAPMDPESKPASRQQLFTSLQRYLCGRQIDADLFEREKIPLGHVMGEVRRDLNVKSVLNDSTTTTTDQNSVCYDVGTAVLTENGMIIGLISEVIGNIRAPNYRVSVPQTVSDQARNADTPENVTPPEATEDDKQAGTRAFDTMINLQDLVDKEVMVYTLPKYSNHISDAKITKKRMENMLHRLESNRTDVQQASAANTELELENLPQDVHYINSLLSKGTEAFSTPFASMWVSDDPNAVTGAPSSPKDGDDMPEAIFEDAEAEKEYLQGKDKSIDQRSSPQQRHNNAPSRGNRGRGRGGKQTRGVNQTRGGNRGGGNGRGRKRTRDERDAPKGYNIHRSEQRAYGSSRFTMSTSNEARAADTTPAAAQEENKGFFQSWCVIS